MSINVMGASGHLGRKVMAAFIELGAAAGHLIASVRTPSKVDDLAERGVHIRPADYTDRDSMTAAFRDTEVLVLIPSTAPVEPRIEQHCDALLAARAAGVRRVVFASLISAIPASRFHISPFLLYAESKLRQSGMEWTILRNNMYLDPIADWIPELMEMGRLPYPVKKGRVAYVSRDDLGRATAGACLNSGHAGKVYELTGPHALSMPELAEIISTVTGHSVRFDSVSDEEYAEICRSGAEDIPPYLIDILISIYWAVDNDEFANVSDHVRQLSGTSPETAESYLRRAFQDRETER